MSLNKTNLALVLTIALGSTAAEVEATFDEAREVLGFAPDNSISPTEAAAAQNTTVAAGGVERDSNGLPWDARIHSSSKAKVESGAWRLRKGVDKGLVAKVEAELKSTVAAAPAATATLPTASAAPPLPLPGAGVPLPPLPTPAAPVNPVFTNFVAFLAQHTKSEANPNGRLTDEWVKQMLTVNGVANGELQNLAHNPALIPQIESGIKTALGIA